MLKFKFTSVLLLCLTLAALAPLAQAQNVPLFVSPQRVIISEDDRTASVSLTNKSDRPRKYQVILVDQAMGETGTTSIVDTFPFSAKRMLRYQPREVTIAAGQRQIVRLQVRRPQGLEAGDYHTHILFEEEEIKAPIPDTDAPDEGAFAVKISTTYGLAIPVVIQQGEQTGSMAFHSVKLDVPATPETPKRELHLKLEHLGNSEALGNLEATFVDDTGETQSIIAPRNVRLYREVETANIAIPILAAYAASDLPPITVTLKNGDDIINQFTVTAN